LYKIESQRRQRVLVLDIQGYCEAEAGEEIASLIDKTFAAEKPGGVIFNFSECKVINSVCVSRLIETIELIAYDHETDTVVCGLDQTKATLFKMVGMLDLAELKDDIETGIKYLDE
jgi:anti-anti-sigma regulatory factor